MKPPPRKKIRQEYFTGKMLDDQEAALSDALVLRAAATILRHNGDQATARRVMTMALKLEAK